MSDYLGNLAQRAISSEAAIQPRPVSLFSSCSGSGYLGAMPAWEWSALLDEEAWQEIDAEVPAAAAHEKIEHIVKTEKPAALFPSFVSGPLREKEVAHAENDPNAASATITKSERGAPPQIFTNAAFREGAVPANAPPVAPHLMMIKEEVESAPPPSFHPPENRASAAPDIAKHVQREAQTLSATPQHAPQAATARKPISHALPLDSSRSRAVPETFAPLQKIVLEMIAPRDEAYASLHETGVVQPPRAEQETRERDLLVSNFIPRNSEMHSELRHIIATAPQPAARPQIVVSNLIQPYVEAAKSALGDASPAQTAPTIRVNIGRIEVRAVTPQTPAPRPKRAAASPRLSLEEYLNQRSGGRR